MQYLPDGQLVYLGRKDNQVKLYGQRVELSEIDTVFTQLISQSTSACSILCKTRPLIALFFSVDSDSAGSEDATHSILPLSPDMKSLIARAREGLAQRLPSHMVPGVLVPISRMPTTSSGKLDRQKLQETLLALSNSEIANLNLGKSGAKRAPTNNLERKLRGLWCQVLKESNEESIGIDDNFFQLGGDSILAMNLASAARAAGFPLKVADIFHSPVLKDSAAYLGDSCKMDGYMDLPLKPFDLLSNGTNRQELLADLAKHTSIDEADVEDAYPCTPFQEGLMAASVKQETAYRACFVFEIDPDIDTSKLKQILPAVIAKEPVLRTRIVHLPRFNHIQIVLKDASVEIESASSLQTYTDSVRSNAMSYESTLSRYALIFEQGKRYFVWAAHHTIYDAQSISITLERLSQAYYGGILQPSPQFNRFVGYVQQQHHSTEWKAFWQETLKGCQPREYPTRPFSQYSCSTTHMRKFRMNLNMASGATGSRRQFTSATLIRASWAVVISQYTETPDVVFGETHVGRGTPVEGIMHMIGPTLATVPVRVDVSQYTTLGELLDAVQNQSLQSMSYEHVGLQNIRTLDESCQLASEFQNLLVIQPPRSNQKIGFHEDKSPDNLGFHNYPLVLECALGEEQIDITFQFNESVLSELEVERIADHLQNVISQIYETDMSMPLTDITLFGDSDRRQIATWNWQDPAIWEQNKLIHDVFEEQAALHGESEAICAWDRSLTYSELNRLSTTLAEHLVENYEIGPEVLVPLVFSKCSWVPVAMLAVLKSGAGFVPIDPAQPLARQLEIIGQANAQLVLLSEDIEHLPLLEFSTLEVSQAFFDIASQARAEVILGQEEMVNDGSATSSESKYTPSSLSMSSGCSHIINVSPTNVAYVIFTSGSTGKPKGVVIEHKNFLSGVLGPRQVALRRSTWSRVLQFASFSFDVSLEDILTTLVSGGTVCIPSEYERMNDIQGFIRKSWANTAYLTPTFANTLTPEAIPSLELLVLGGERVAQNHIDTWANRLYLRNGKFNHLI